MQERRRRIHIVVPHRVLLIEVERYCYEIGCKALTRIGLTKDEARNYHGFECNACGKWNDDILTKHDVPDWWSELNSSNE